MARRANEPGQKWKFSSPVHTVLNWVKKDEQGDKIQRAHASCISLNEEGFLKWKSSSENDGFLIGAARLQAIFKHINFEEENSTGGRSWRLVERYKLCPITMVTRFRYENLETRVKFALSDETVVRNWLASFLRILDQKDYETFSNGNLTIQDFPEYWKQFREKIADKDFGLDLKGCCGVSDVDLEILLDTSGLKPLPQNNQSGAMGVRNESFGGANPPSNEMSTGNQMLVTGLFG